MDQIQGIGLAATQADGQTTPMPEKNINLWNFTRTLASKTALLILPRTAAASPCTQNKTEPTSNMTQSLSTYPKAEPTFTGTGITLGYDVTPEVSRKLNTMEMMSVEEFNKLDREERLLYGDLALRDVEKNDMTSYFLRTGDQIGMTIASPISKYIEPDNSNSSQQIVDQINYTTQLMAIPKTQNEPYSATRAEKLMSMHYFYVRPEQPGQTLRDRIKEAIASTPETGAQIPPHEAISDANPLNCSVDLETGTTPISTKVIALKNSMTGNVAFFSFTLTSYTNIYGEESKVWLIVGEPEDGAIN